jgi:predicted TIM-barrel fold metal-dependent hydrolase
LIIDVNMHALPDYLFKDEAILESYLRIAPQAYGEFARLTTLPGTDRRQIIIEKPRGYENLNFSQNAVDIKARLEIMDKAGLDKAILRTPCWQEWLTLEMCRQANDSMCKTVELHSDKFLALATIPPWGDKGCLQELERCLCRLGFVGVELAAHYGNLYLDDPVFRPYLRRLNELSVPAVVHHTPLPVEYHNLYEYNNLRRSIGRCIDQITAVGRELFSNLFEECPNLRFIHTMLGGGIFAFTEQILPRKSKEREEIERFDQQILKYKNYFRNNLYFDITTPLAWSKSQLECAVKEFGADHILYGSSYPVRLDWVLNGVEYVKSLDISGEEKELIFCGNAKRLFNIRC